MAGQQPPSWFTGQDPAGAKDGDLAARKKQLRAEVMKLLSQDGDKGRADRFYPYLLVRSVLGDRGDRPINVPFWESPDIWTAAGDPASSPALPPNHGGVLEAGKPSTVYAHVWNLGLAPLAGVVVEFYWVNPSLTIDGTHANLIGTARCQLAGRGGQGSHLLVKCPTAWVPTIENGGHECIVVRIYGIGDPLGANDWAPWLNRHVAQRNVSVVPDESARQNLLSSLDLTRLGHRVQLLQVGAREAEFAARIAAPHARVADAVQTRVLAELKETREVAAVTATTHAPAGALAPVHALAVGGAPKPPAAHGATPIVDAHRIVTETPAKTSDVAALLAAVDRLHPGTSRLGRPATGEVHVLRLATYDKEQLVGGYTLVVPGK